MEWKPIESAPKDGTLVFVYCPDGLPDRTGYEFEKVPYTIARYTAGERSGVSWQSIEEIMEYHDYGGYTGVSTWTECLECNPTHWAPLTPPKETTDD